MKNYIVTLLALVLLAGCQRIQEKQETANSIPDFLFDKADATFKAKILGGSLEYDADVVSLKSDLWCAWLEFIPGKGDMIWVGVQDGSSWKKKQCATREPGEYAAPTLTIDAAGYLWLSYEARQDNQWDVYI